MKWHIRRFYEMAEKRSGRKSIRLFPADAVESISKRLSMFINKKENMRA